MREWLIASAKEIVLRTISIAAALYVGRILPLAKVGDESACAKY